MSAETLWLEVGLVLFLIFANGFFAAAEIAVIATRKSRLDTLVEKGVRAAALVARLKNEPDRFLATVQIGVTLVGTLASAVGGAAAIEYLKPVIESLAIPGPPSGARFWRSWP
jgi:putative hemolysin